MAAFAPLAPSGLCFSGGVASIRRRTSSSLGRESVSDIDQTSPEYFEEHAVHVARVVYSAVTFDDAISTFIAEFLGLEDYQENALLRPMGHRAKVDLLQRLTNHYLPRTVAKSMAGFFNAAKEAIDGRNALIHGVPVELEGGAFGLVSWVGKNKLLGEPEPWPVERVCQLAQRFILLGDQVELLVGEFRKHKANASGDRETRD